MPSLLERYSHAGNAMAAARCGPGRSAGGWNRRPGLLGSPIESRRPVPWLLVAILFFSWGLGRAEKFQEYEVKAEFLLNFAHFVQWPAESFATPEAPLVIGVLGVDPFGRVLEAAVQGQFVGRRPLRLARYARMEEVDSCHILFIAASESERLAQVVGALRGRHILTVCEVDGSALRGVMVRLITENHRVRLRVNLGEAKAAGLVLSSRLLRPAEIVTTTKEND